MFAQKWAERDEFCPLIIIDRLHCSIVLSLERRTEFKEAFLNFCLLFRHKHFAVSRVLVRKISEVLTYANKFYRQRPTKISVDNFPRCRGLYLKCDSGMMQCLISFNFFFDIIYFLSIHWLRKRWTVIKLNGKKLLWRTERNAERA